MDLEERGLRAAANRLFNRYLAPEPPEALTGLVALPLFLSLRAAIRAKVEAAGARAARGREARRSARARAPIFRLRGPVSRPCSAPTRRRRRALRRRQERACRSARPRNRPAARRAMAAQRCRAQSDVRGRGDRSSAGLGLCQRDHARRLSAAYRQGADRASGRAGGAARRDLCGGRRTRAPATAVAAEVAVPLRGSLSRRASRDAARAHRCSARRRFGRRRRRGAPAESGPSASEKGWAALLGRREFERHDDPRAGRGSAAS